MRPLETGTSSDAAHGAAMERAKDLRAAAVATALAALLRPAAAMIRKSRQPRQAANAAAAGAAAAGAAAAGADLPMPDEPPVLIERAGAIATLTLNRPGQLNAINYAMVDRLQHLLDEIEQDDTIRSVILTGAGARAFSAGADISEFSRSVAAGRVVAVRDFVSRGQALTARIERFSKPIVVAVNGLAFGGGCEILEAAHLAVAADTATFAKPEIRLDMPPTFGGTQRLPRIAGRKRALEHLLTGEPFDAGRALSLGLVNSVVPASALMSTAHLLGRRATMQSPRAVAAILGAVSRGADKPIGEALLDERAAFASLVGTPELRDGLAAWRDRQRARS